MPLPCSQVQRGGSAATTPRPSFLLLIGDDLGDFLPCVRTKPYAPCTEKATAASRMQMVEDSRLLWGNGWYILPNPMHGSWTPAIPR